jgi:hypothetical protein
MEVPYSPIGFEVLCRPGLDGDSPRCCTQVQVKNEHYRVGMVVWYTAKRCRTQDSIWKAHFIWNSVRFALVFFCRTNAKR